MPLPHPPRVSGGEHEHGHLEELRTDPIALMRRVRDECGDVGVFRLADRDVVLLSGAEANEFFFRSDDEDLDQQAAYPFMKPIFGEGVVFDASPERRKEMLHNSALRGEQMKGHATTIGVEVENMVADWGDEGEIDLLEFFAELTIYTSSACLIGKKFRDELDDRFARLYHELEQGTDAIAFVDPYAPIESFRRRDAARLALVELVQGIMNGRIANPPRGKADRDMLDVLVSIRDEDGTLRFTADEITGIFISMMFAGHHTTSGTAAWSLIELLRHPDAKARVTTELDELYSDGADISFHALRQIPVLEAVIKESLRLHPPLIILLRVARGDFEVGGFAIDEGNLVAATPAISNRIPEDFPDPDTFDPGRYIDPNQEDIVNRWTWIPFGAGRHRCVGAAFAQMQLKAIFSILLRDYEFEMAQPADSYRNDHSKMVVQLQQPCRVRYRRRAARAGTAGAGVGVAAAPTGCPVDHTASEA
ncbi:cytochrome P450 [Rhodococcus olei]